jgi:two-component system sensor histidine kinase TctE
VPRALEAGIDLGLEGAPPASHGVLLEGNPSLLKEMLRNLVDNAIHYTPRGGVVTVRVLAAGLGQPLELQVEDNGPGIPAAERELIFQPFYRALGSNTDGSGLGLSIVREIAQLHQGHVEARDAQPGRSPPGTVFSVRFEERRAEDQALRMRSATGSE